MIFHNITPTTPKKQIYSDNTTPTKASSNTNSPRRTVSLKTSTPINQNKNCFSPTPTTHSTPNNFPSHYTSIAHPTTINDMDIIVDSPEKHSSLMESYVTFRITTHVMFLFLLLLPLLLLLLILLLLLLLLFVVYFC